MRCEELLELMKHARRRAVLVGNDQCGTVVGLDLEGRLFATVDDQIISRVVPEAIENRSTKDRYWNPGGDALWPAPEGTIFGYEYASGVWRVPPGITGAVWNVVEEWSKGCVIRAEIDLVNNRGLGLPCEFERRIEVDSCEGHLLQKVTEMIRYKGRGVVEHGDFLLAPWSLSQFDSMPGGHVVFASTAEIRDLYGPSDAQRQSERGQCRVNVETRERFQLGLSGRLEGLDYIVPGRVRVRRRILAVSHEPPIDIADAPPEQRPSEHGVQLSLYCDPSGFMEMEACGGSPARLLPGTETVLCTLTEMERNES
ncbi:MAG: hypothetical protein Q4G68_02575 [Planctomycetia bacterium]|nr:hypothetical protein [Planctomycetia bacterium]